MLSTNQIALFSSHQHHENCLRHDQTPSPSETGSSFLSSWIFFIITHDRRGGFRRSHVTRVIVVVSFESLERIPSAAAFAEPGLLCLTPRRRGDAGRREVAFEGGASSGAT